MYIYSTRLNVLAGLRALNEGFVWSEIELRVYFQAYPMTKAPTRGEIKSTAELNYDIPTGR